MATIVGYYIVDENASPEDVLLYSSVATLLLWVVAALTFHWLAKPEHAIPSSNSELLIRRSEAYAQFTAHGGSVGDKVQRDLENIAAHQGALAWTKGDGYTYVWKRLHRAEEILLEMVAPETLANEAVYDALRLTGSNIPHHDELIDKLRTAVSTLCPGSQKYFEPSSRPSAPLTIVTPSILPEATLGKVYDWTLMATGGLPPYRWEAPALAGSSLDISEGGILSGSPSGTPRTVGFDVQVKDCASVTTKKSMEISMVSASSSAKGEPGSLERGFVRTVRQVINEYRDVRWNGLILARNRLVSTMFWVSLAALALLVLAILGCALRCTILSITTIYLVGAVVGLLGRLRAEAQADTAVEDEGLSIARLLVTPLFSGVGAVGGVLLTALLAVGSTSFGPKPMANEPLSIVTETQLPEGVVDCVYCEELVASGGAPPYRWALADSGALGHMLELSVKGLLCGRPTTDTVLCFDVQVADNDAATATKAFGLEIRDERKVATTDGCCPEMMSLLERYFDLGPRGLVLILAAVFGLTPGLLLDRVLQQSETYKKELKSSQASQGLVA
jgi:hypothetical protein